VDTSAVSAVVNGSASYDGLGDDDQALVRAIWDDRIAECLAHLDLRPTLRAAGIPWIEGDPSGKPVERR
jgi:hypothetical protein